MVFPQQKVRDEEATQYEEERDCQRPVRKKRKSRQVGQMEHLACFFDVKDHDQVRGDETQRREIGKVRDVAVHEVLSVQAMMSVGRGPRGNVDS